MSELDQLRRRVCELEGLLAERGTPVPPSSVDEEPQPPSLGLAEREVLLSEAEKAVQMGCWMWEVPSDRVSWSEGLFRIFGLDPARASASSEAFFASVHPEDRERLRAFSRANVERGTTEPVSFRVQRPSGEVREVVMDSAATLAEGQRLVRVVGTIIDVTYRSQLERRLSQAHEMEAIGRLAGGVAHDFNNLLMIIGANLALLRRSHPHDDRIGDIGQAAEAAAGLTRELLAFGRQAELEPKAIDLNDVLAGGLRLVRRIVGANIELVFDATPELWAIAVDPSEIRRVLLNLVANARDAMPRGGALRIVTRNVPGGRGVGDGVELCVTDDGDGMDEATRARVFEPFFTTKAAGKGVGLGLTSVFGIVAQCGGTIDVASEVGRGTAFTIRFRRAHGEAHAGHDARPHRARDGVDDGPGPARSGALGSH